MALPIAAAGLAPLLVELGAPLLAGILRAKGGTGAARVVEAVGAALGTGPAPDAIAERIRAAPDAAAAQVRTLETDRAAEWAELFRAVAAATEATAETMRSEAASASLLQRIWRPVFGLVYAAAFGAMALALVVKILAGAVETLGVLADVGGLLLGFYGMGASVLGVYVWRRTDEKRSGKV
ncbi:3TM-type holin [Prosthecomicrobium pneumaticum]|uniref:Ribokinase n=1 Tax=Prosthecomicrobium pneumaticum TaxID=81895 RepID=A0A7W9FPF2_9HYPH|nr:3TM-type holin [Prosthecomicrobium pneumaticum]MBB5754336.1 hypothetical protein [Prosthecomicrobium pneumaticum]